MMRFCARCFDPHPIEFFNKDKTRPDGTYPYCKDCSRAACKKVYRKYHDRHVGLKRRWKAANPEKHKAINHAWGQNNPEKVRERTARYRARLARATPSWVNMTEIASVYDMCPSGHHVDHIHPLAGKNFCGLNVLWNLQYLPAAEHYKKGTKPPVEAGGHYNV